MSLILKPLSQNKAVTGREQGRQVGEGEYLFRRILSHDDNLGAQSSLIMGQPGSCKTAVSCAIAEYFMRHYPHDKIFWRNALNAPIQVFKLPRWHLLVEEGSGIVIFNRKTGADVTKKLQAEGSLSFFNGFDNLLKQAQPGMANCVFFHDRHEKGVDKDRGTLQWFDFIRTLLGRSEWYHVFLDEYQEMVKAGYLAKMWHVIDEHSDDVSTARKANVGIHANCHQTQEIDYRVLANIMIIVQLYGARPYRYSPVTKRALSALKKPGPGQKAEGWISEGGNFGKLAFPKVYVLPEGMDLAARMDPDKEDTKLCKFCNRQFIPKRNDQVYCDASCKQKAYRQNRRPVKRVTDKE